LIFFILFWKNNRRSNEKEKQNIKYKHHISKFPLFFLYTFDLKRTNTTAHSSKYVNKSNRLFIVMSNCIWHNNMNINSIKTCCFIGIMNE
jgi:hypothetical protein